MDGRVKPGHDGSCCGQAAEASSVVKCCHGGLCCGRGAEPPPFVERRHDGLLCAPADGLPSIVMPGLDPGIHASGIRAMTDTVTYGDWTAQPERIEEFLAPTQAKKLAGLLDLDPDKVGDGFGLPPMWHWLYFHASARTAEIGPDGHPRRGGFFPPVELQRRMYAGSTLTFHEPLRVGAPATRTGEIASLEEKQGRNGRMVLAKAVYRFEQAGRLCMTDEQSIIYLEPGGGVLAPEPVPFAPPAGAEWREVRPDPVLLFRYSALSYNSHRIHYDREYAMGEEGYPGLVVHGPLTALLLAEFGRSLDGRPPRRLSFRGLAPLFADAPFHLVARRTGTGALELEAIRPDGAVANRATLDFHGD
jgi:3-methylfumaryl-CoA hydratase